MYHQGGTKQRCKGSSLFALLLLPLHVRPRPQTFLWCFLSQRTSLLFALFCKLHQFSCMWQFHINKTSQTLLCNSVINRNASPCLVQSARAKPHYFLFPFTQKKNLLVFISNIKKRVKVVFLKKFGENCSFTIYCFPLVHNQQLISVLSRFPSSRLNKRRF